jgi:hypothetical protein
LVWRAVRTEPDRRRSETLRSLAVDVEQDLTVLRRCAAALGVARPRGREVAALVAERAGRLKLNGRIRGVSPLSPVVESEALILAVTGKAQLWKVLALADVARQLPADVELDEMARRAVAQQRILEALHEAQVLDALRADSMAK